MVGNCRSCAVHEVSARLRVEVYYFSEKYEDGSVSDSPSVFLRLLSESQLMTFSVGWCPQRRAGACQQGSVANLSSWYVG